MYDQYRLQAMHVHPTDWYQCVTSLLVCLYGITFIIQCYPTVILSVHNIGFYFLLGTTIRPWASNV